MEPTEITKAEFDGACRSKTIPNPIMDGDAYGAVYQPRKRAYGVLDGKPVWCWITAPDPNPRPVEFPFELAKQIDQQRT